MGPWGAGGGDKAHPEHVEAFCPVRAGCGHVSYHVCHKSFVLGLLLSSSVGVFGGQLVAESVVLERGWPAGFCASPFWGNGEVCAWWTSREAAPGAEEREGGTKSCGQG